MIRTTGLWPSPTGSSKGYAGQVQHEVAFGGILVSKELQKHAIELIPARPGSLGFLESNLYQGLC